MPKINLDVPVLDLDEKPILDADGKGVTLRSVSVNAILGVYQNENPDQVEKLNRYDLAMRLHKGGVQELSEADITRIREFTSKAYTALVLGRVTELTRPSPHMQREVDQLRAERAVPRHPPSGDVV